MARPDYVTQPNRRVALFGALALAFASLDAQAKPCRPPRTLFVCRYGTVKSPSAREHLRRLAAKRGLTVAVRSRGLAPEDHLTPALAAELRAEGLDPTREPVRTLAPADVAWADIVLSFESPSSDPLIATARDWSGVASMNTDYARARADLQGRMKDLLDEFASRSC